MGLLLNVVPHPGIPIEALRSGNVGTAVPRLRRHHEALRSLDPRNCAGDVGLSTMAQAAVDRNRGDALAALRGFEQAAIGAESRGLHWLAALAHEQAAQTAADAGLAGAARHYREQAVASNRRWGAPGRTDGLCAAWNTAPAPCDSRQFALDDAACFGKALAHELNQPLAAVTLHAAAAARWLRRAQPDLERALDSLELIGAAGRQAGDIVCGLQRLAAGQDKDGDAVDVDATVRDTMRSLRRPLRRHGITVELELGLGSLAIDANRVQLQQVLNNLVVNAIDAHAAGPAGDRRIRIASRTCGDGQVELAVSDNGPGIAAADRERVFTSPFSTKPARAGGAGGMGLSICLSIVRAHGGHIWHEACAPRGACFRLRLPLRAPA